MPQGPSIPPKVYKISSRWCVERHPHSQCLLRMAAFTVVLGISPSAVASPSYSTPHLLHLHLLRTGVSHLNHLPFHLPQLALQDSVHPLALLVHHLPLPLHTILRPARDQLIPTMQVMDPGGVPTICSMFPTNSHVLTTSHIIFVVIRRMEHLSIRQAFLRRHQHPLL